MKKYALLLCAVALFLAWNLAMYVASTGHGLRDLPGDLLKLPHWIWYGVPSPWSKP